ncbi:MAG: HesA/MoeB/ThiF family protein [Methanosarcinales archaeon]|nr:HesA/MoeB/ThiF family protein [Methanosarcinales archaeon]
MNPAGSKHEYNAPVSERYDRQLPLFGTSGQNKLAAASVFIAGAGGLGSPVATYLAAAGVGRIILLDCDTVEKTNLNRQFLHREADIGRPKAESGAEKLRLLNPEIQAEAVCGLLTEENIEKMAGDCQIIVDALDNDKTRRILAAFAVRTKKPYFHAAVSGFRGQFASFHPEDGPCYFCMFSKTESEESKISENQTVPIVGATAGVVGSMQANEIIKYITGAGKEHSGKLFIWDGVSNTLDFIEIEKDEDCEICSKSAAKK